MWYFPLQSTLWVVVFNSLLVVFDKGHIVSCRHFVCWEQQLFVFRVWIVESRGGELVRIQLIIFWFKRMQSIGTLKIGRPNLWRLQCTQRIIEIVAAALERMFATVFCNSFQSINCKLKRVFLGGPGRLTPVSRAKSFAALIYGSFKISNQSRCCCPFHLVQTMCRPMVAKTL